MESETGRANLVQPAAWRSGDVILVDGGATQAGFASAGVLSAADCHSGVCDGGNYSIVQFCACFAAPPG